MRRELTSPTLSFPCESSFSRGRVFSFLPRRGTPPRARESHPPRVNSARTRRALDGRVLTRPELRGKNESGTGTRFRTSTNHQSLLLSSFSSLLFRLFCHSRQPLLRPIVLRYSFSSRFKPASSPIHANVLPLRLQRHLPYNYNPCPLHSAGSSHTTYVPRASELVATAGRSLDYAPSLFHHHPTATLAYTLSFSLSLSLSVFLSALMAILSPLFSPSPALPPPPSPFAHPLPARSSLSRQQSLSSSSITSAPFYISLSPSRLSNYHQTVSFRYTDVVSSVERSLPLTLALMT